MLSPRARALLLLAALGASDWASAEEYFGKPLIYNFSSRDVGGEVQHWTRSRTTAA